MADPLLKYHPFPSPERYSKEQQVINFKQKGHLNIQKEENNSSINYKPGRRVSKGISYAGNLFLHNLFLSLGAQKSGSSSERLEQSVIAGGGSGRWGWRDGGGEKRQTNWNQHGPKPAGEPKPHNFEHGKEKYALGPAWLLQTINSKGRDVSHSSVQKGDWLKSSLSL